MTRIFAATAIAVATMSLASSASATVFNESYALDAISGAGIGGVSAGGSGTLTFTFDDSTLNAGSGLVSPLGGDLTALTLTFGTASFSLASDVNAPVDPNVTVIADVPDFVTFTPPGYTFTATLSPTTTFSLVNTVGETILTNVAVPEPAAVALLGVGLLGLTLVRRRA